jgi:ketosteroid isomerase-like protein
MMSIYADDAVLMPPNAPAFRGRDAIRQFWSGLLGMGKIEAEIAADTVVQSGDLATEVGHFALTITPPNAPAPVKDRGKYVITWRRTGGQWKAIYDIFNSDLPAPPPR